MVGTPEILPIIEKKKRGEALSKEEIAYFVMGAAKGTIPDYQLAALLMAIRFQGMASDEAVELSLAMARSGDHITLDGLGGIPVDKHSTGGVGDTTTLVIAPLVAACGAPVAKMSGSGLGHTGGTLDKLRSIPGMSVEMPREKFIAQVKSIGIAVCSQTADLAPADKSLYALRNATATVDSLPLIASSIMSKKLVSGARGLVLDVKVGRGALMHTLKEAETLARIMVGIGCDAGVESVALITDMNQPLGMNVGNALEVEEAIDILSGRTTGALLDVSLLLGCHMLKLAGVTKTPEEGMEKLQKALSSGAGLEKLRQMIASQGGDARVCDDTGYLPKAKVIQSVYADRDGYITGMDTTALGYTAQHMGAGRMKKDDVIDPAVGFVLRKRIGAFVKKGDELGVVHAKNDESAEIAAKEILAEIELAPALADPPPIAYRLVTGHGEREL